MQTAPFSPVSPANSEASWCDARRLEVEICLEQQGLQASAGRIGDGPAWFVAPYASVWAVESLQRPEWIGWWVICGDLPSDVLPAHDLATPRDALRAFGKRWLLHAQGLDRGQVPAAWGHVADPELPKLTAQLKKRGAALLLWADDDASWPDEMTPSAT